MPVITKESTYQGKPTLELKWKEDSPYPFSFGVGKAKLILAAHEQIKAFVEAHKNDPKSAPVDRSGDAPAGERQPEYQERKPEYNQ